MLFRDALLTITGFDILFVILLYVRSEVISRRSTLRQDALTIFLPTQQS